MVGFIMLDRIVGFLLRPYYYYYPNQYQFYQQYDNIVRRKSDADILVIGSSHAHHGIDPAVLSVLCGCRADNISIDGSDAMTIYFFTRAYLQHNVVPRVAVVEMTLLDVKEGTGGHNLLLLERLDWSERIKYALQSFDVQFLARWLVMSYRYRSALGRFLVRDIPTPDAPYQQSNFIPLDGVVLQDDASKVVAPLLASEENSVSDSIQGQYLIKLLMLLREKHIRVIMIQPSVLGGWVRSLKHFPDFEKQFIYAAFANKISYYNLNDPGYAALQKPEYFYDSEHLNRSGALVYTDFVWNLFR